MRIAIQDANILIDLELAGLFDSYFELRIETHTSDFIVQELRQGGHEAALSHIRADRIRMHEFTEPQLSKIVALYEEVQSGPDLADCSVLYLARELDATLLTNEKPLRKAAGKRCIEVHGTLWILDRLVETKLLAPAEAAACIKRLLAANRYLPKSACNERLRNWEGEA